MNFARHAMVNISSFLIDPDKAQNKSTLGVVYPMHFIHLRLMLKLFLKK